MLEKQKLFLSFTGALCALRDGRASWRESAQEKCSYAKLSAILNRGGLPEYDGNGEFYAYPAVRNWAGEKGLQLEVIF